MSEPSNLPKLADRPNPIGYVMGVEFHPQIKLDRKRGFEFATRLADCVDPQQVYLTDASWRFGQTHGSKAGIGLEVRIDSSTLQVEAAHPSSPQEWYEQRFQMILGHFQQMFKPNAMLTSSASIRVIIEVDGDARKFITDHLMSIDPNMLAVLHRPIHMFGVRIFLPPFVQENAVPQKGRKSKTDRRETPWGVELRIESLVDDPTKLFVEANATWPNPVQWTDVSQQEALGRLQLISQYVGKDVVEMLKSRSRRTEKEE